MTLSVFNADWLGLFQSFPKAVAKVEAKNPCTTKTIFVGAGDSCGYLVGLGFFTSNTQLQQLNPGTSCSNYFTSSAALCLAPGAYSTLLSPRDPVTTAS